MKRLAVRSVVVGSTFVVAMGLFAAPASADELTDVLERARASTWTATRLTVSVWGDQTNVVRERVEHADGAEMIRVDETWSMVGNGRQIVMGESPTGLAFLTTMEPITTNRYEIGAVTDCKHLRRGCRFIEIAEGDIVRARMVVDVRTGAPLITYIYDGDGRTFRTVSLSDFTPHRTYEWPEDRTDVPVEVIMHDDSIDLPDGLHGYALIDSFAGPASSDQGFYTDGLFSFSLFTIAAGTRVQGFDEATAMVTDRGVYDILVTARDTRVHWEGGGSQYVLVGDLPPDHVAAVLAELPEPKAGNMLARLWRALFG